MYKNIIESCGPFPSTLSGLRRGIVQGLWPCMSVSECNTLIQAYDQGSCVPCTVKLCPVMKGVGGGKRMGVQVSIWTMHDGQRGSERVRVRERARERKLEKMWKVSGWDVVWVRVCRCLCEFKG